MRYLITTILLVLSSASFSAEQSLPSFKCTTVYNGGVTHRQGPPRAVDFKVGPDNEFRLEHRSRLSESVQTWFDSVDGGAVVIDHSDLVDGYKTTKSDYFVRSASDDPESFMSWRSCISSGYPARGNVSFTCSWPEHGPSWIFKMDAEKSRFTVAYLGSWFNETDDSEYKGDDSIFSFGTCATFYD